MQVSWPSVSIGTMVAVIVVILCVLALFLPDLWNRTFVVGCLLALGVARLT